jgi:hypothetical protein
MRLVTYEAASGPRTGLVFEDRIIDVADAAGLPSAMIALIA